MSAAESRLAGSEAVAPVSVVERVCRGDSGLKVVSRTVGGMEIAVNISERATFGDLAKAFSERHADCERVHLVLQEHGPVTLWERARIFADFATNPP